MVVLSTMIRFWQEAKSNRAADKLKAMVSNTATVMRRDVAEDAAPVVAHYSVGCASRPRAVEVPISCWCLAM